MLKNYSQKYNNKKKAFVSIFAIFFSAIVISILTGLYVLLVKQIELMALDYSSFQSLYVADSAFECALYKEQTATGTNSTFLTPTITVVVVNGVATNVSSTPAPLGECAVSGDLNWVVQPAVTSGRAKSTFTMDMSSTLGDFCAFVSVDKETRSTAYFTSPPDPNTIFISGQSRACGGVEDKVIERVLEFFY